MGRTDNPSTFFSIHDPKKVAFLERPTARGHQVHLEFSTIYMFLLRHNLDMSYASCSVCPVLISRLAHCQDQVAYFHDFYFQIHELENFVTILYNLYISFCI